MIADEIKSLIKNGEGLTTEFKRAKDSLPQSLYQTICAFLNTNGGDIILGVEDNGNISGVNPNCISAMKKSFADSMNNQDTINPIVSLKLKEHNIDGKIVLHVFVPESSQVHRFGNKFFIRNHECDQDVSKHNYALMKLCTRRSGVFSEDKVYPDIKFEDLREDLIERARNMAVIHRKNHPWERMSAINILKSAHLYLKDEAGQEGFTLACILLFGKDDIIQRKVSAFEMDLIKRVENTGRYDDRLILNTNLIECCEKSATFIEKHLPDPFYLEGKIRRSIRDAILREVIANMLMHQEYSFGEPTRFIIERNRIIAENSNNPRIHGIVMHDSLKPHPKNPHICKVFREIGMAETLGSGFEAIYKYSKEYTGADPIIKDEDTFVFELPILKSFFPLSQVNDQVTVQASEQVTVQASEQVTDKILKYCRVSRSLAEIMEYCGFKNRGHFKSNFLNPIIQNGKLVLTIPEKPKSPNQRYMSKL